MPQVDAKTIIPPYFKLERRDNNTQDLSTPYMVSALESIAMVKRYFSHLSTRTGASFIYCSLILAQMKSFSEVMERAQYTLQNQGIGL
jgi:hypothetical protein